MESLKVRRELRLSSPVDGADLYVVGENCDAIDRRDGCYEVHKGSTLLRVESGRVVHFKQDPRPGYEQEQRDAAEGASPSYAKELPDGTWLCLTCGATKPKLHALKIHHGKQHGGR